MHDNKNLIFVIAFSTLILFLWQVFYVSPRLEQVKKQQEQALRLAEEKKKHQQIEAVKPSSEKLLSREDAIKEAGRIQISAPRLSGSISLKGARFDDLTLANYKISVDENSPDVILLSPSNTENPYFAEFGWVGGNESDIAPNSNTIWESKDKTLSPGKPITLSWDNKNGLRFFIDISVDENYMFTITRKIQNYGKEEATLLPYGLISRTTDYNHQTFAILHEGALNVLDGVLSEVNFHDLKEDKKTSYKNNNGWFGFTDKYWLTAIIPGKNGNFDSNFLYFQKNEQDRFQTDYLGEKIHIKPGDNIKVESLFFAGAKEVNLLDNYAKSFDITLFDRAVDFGKLYFITKPLFKLLTLFHHLVGNFGIAILLLTIVVKLLMFPLANKSYISMHQLKKMQPRVNEIHAKHDDKIKANKAIMELYKNEKVNPMSGCLPMLLQIPVFFALYKVLFVTIEMRHASFFGWVHDLSAPDPTTIFNLFGLISWVPPAYLHIGAWPIIMAITMYVQQLLTPAPSDPVQAKVMKMLPLIFVVMFASFPAGLVIYWAWNNILSILQQWLITRKLPSGK